MAKQLFLKILLAALLLAIASGCAGGSQVVLVEGSERAEILAQAEPIAEGVFAGMSARDYSLFSQDFDATMQNAMKEAAFLEMMNTLDAKVGRYLSSEVSKVEKAGDFVAVTYNAKYEQEENVSWRVVFTPGDPMQVSGLWYDSPKLRTK